MIKVLIADDQELIRESLKIILDVNSDIKVVGLAEDGRKVLDLLNKTDEDIKITSIRIDKARFPVPLGDELIAAMDSLYETITVSSVEPETAAAQFIEELEWHLGEG